MPLSIPTVIQPLSTILSQATMIIRAISLFVEIIANAVLDADKEIGIEIIETLEEEGLEGLRN